MTQSSKTWNWAPNLPIAGQSVFVFPPNPWVILKVLSSVWLTVSGRVVILLTACISWLFFTPPLAQCIDLELGWVLHIYARNLCLMILFAGGLHLYFYTFKIQGDELRFDSRDNVRDASVFTFKDQLYDNIFWSVASGLTIWTLYEVLFMWGYANDVIPRITLAGNPVWYCLLFVLIPMWYALHFYWVHRLEHWKPLYKVAHSVHHRNINTGPWSGTSMHPLEHLIYVASPLIHVVVPSSPLHVIYHFQFTMLAAIITHCGYEALLVRGKRIIELGYFFHQLHHRFFDCNYGTDDMPWDKWSRTFHDGTDEATKALREKQRRRGRS